MITLQVETFDEFYSDSLELLKNHWKEVALNQDEIPLMVDVNAYRKAESEGTFHLVTMRKDGKLVGYHAVFVKPHLHYQSSLTGFTDVYYIRPGVRGAFEFIKMEKFVEKTLKERGVQRVISTTKKKLNLGRIFERMGYLEAETVWTKILK